MTYDMPAPRHATLRDDAAFTDGDLLRRVAHALGYDLFGWQQYVGDVSLERDPDGYRRYKTVGVNVSRQCGKTTLLAARICLECLGVKRRIAYTAQDRVAARSKWEELVELIMSTDFRHRVKKVHRGVGIEHVEFFNGSHFGIVTPNRKAGRGKTLDLALIDEALTLRNFDVMAALQPTLATRRNGQLWVVGNAGDADSVMWNHMRDIGRGLLTPDDTGDDEATSEMLARMCWFEWGALDEKCDVNDLDEITRAVPSLGRPHGVTPESVRESIAIMPERQARQEILNVWLASSVARVIDEDTWKRCAEPAVTVGSTISLALDVNPDRSRGAVVVCGEESGRFPVEVILETSDLDALVTAAVKVAMDYTVPIHIDGGGAAASLVPLIDRVSGRLVTVNELSARQMAQAANLFVHNVKSRLVAHMDDERLNASVAQGQKRPIGASWGWERRAGDNIAPLIAASIAHRAVVSEDTLVPAIH